MAAFPFDVGADILAVADGTEEVTVTQVDPDTGAAPATANGVLCFGPAYTAGPVPVGDGEVSETTRTFHLLASAIPFVPRHRDTVTRTDGSVWSIGTVDVEAFGTFHVCSDCVKKRG